MSKRGGKDLDAEGEVLWRHVTQSVTPYTRPSMRAQKVIKKKPAAPSTVLSTPDPAPLRSGLVKGLDRSTEKRLRRGQLTIEGRLDLHGMTQAGAHAALLRFVQSAHANGKRTVLVITGKGARKEGVLRRLLPLWVETDDLSRFVSAFSPARPQDGGDGAFYLRLRKNKL